MTAASSRASNARPMPEPTQQCGHSWSSRRCKSAGRCDPPKPHACERESGHGAWHICPCGGTKPNPDVPVDTGRDPFAGVDIDELRWAAGFYDGEGSSYASVSSGKRFGHATHLTVAQIDPEPLERFRRAVGGLGRVEGPFYHTGRKANLKHHPQWFFRATSFEEVQAIAALLWRFLCTPKREQFTKTVTRFLGAPRPKGFYRTRSRLGRL